jgi:dTDP-4-amino-4,6-dideoxygalactose transaminase
MVKSVESGWLVRGKYTDEFERKLSKFLGKDAFMTSSCTASLHMSLILAGVKKGDEVITTPLSWVSTANSILYCQAKPVFVDTDENGLIDIDKIEDKISTKTSAIIPVHIYGQMVDMKKLRRLADMYNLPIIEDAAHALEAERDGIKPGQLGFSACFSFHAAKNITSGQGGAIVTHNIERCKTLVRDGVENIDGKRVMTDFGYKYDLTDFQAALLIGQLDRIEKSHAKRLEVFKRYEDGLRWYVKFPQRIGKHACHMFTIRVENRDQIRKRLLDKGIETSIHYSPIHLEPYYQKIGFKKGSLPIAERLGEQIITLPTYALTTQQQDYIIKSLKEVI